MNSYWKPIRSGIIGGILGSITGTALFLVASPPAWSDSSSYHACSALYDRTNEWSVSSYKDCIQMFVEEQNDAIKTHRDAAEEAIAEWNSFANGWR